TARVYAEEGRRDDRAERVADVAHAVAVKTDAGRLQVATENQRAANRGRQRDQVGFGLAHVVAAGQQARQVDEVRTRTVRRTVGRRRAGRVVHQVQIEGALGRPQRFGELCGRRAQR